MRSSLPVVIFGLWISAAGLARADEAAHYAGELICSDRIIVHLDIAADRSARLSSRSRGSDFFADIGQGWAEITGNALRLLDGDQPRWLQGRLEPDGKTIAATLLTYDATPDLACRPGALTRLEGTAQAHNEALLALLENAAPSLEDAERVAAMQRLRADVIYLPEIERPAMADRLREAINGFWQRFWAAEASRLEAMLAASASDISALETRMTAASADGLSPEDTAIRVPMLWLDDPGASSGNFARHASKLLADRRHAIGEVPAPLDFTAPDADCDRITLAGLIYDLNGIEMVFRFPADYWTPAGIDKMRASLKACEQRVPEVTRGLYAEAYRALEQSIPEAEKRAANRQWLEAERDRMLALPRDVETLIATNGYELSRDALSERDIRDAERLRFAGRALSSVRDETMAAAKAGIDQQLAGMKPGDAGEADVATLCNKAASLMDLGQHCNAAIESYVARSAEAHLAKSIEAIKSAPRSIAGLKATAGYALPPIVSATFGDRMNWVVRQQSESFESVVAPLRAEAVTAGTGEIEAAFLAAKPGEASETAARELCALSGQGLEALSEACTKAELGYLERRKVMLCDRAVTESAPPSELLEARYNLAKAGEPVALVGGRDFLCGLRRLGLAAVFEDDSGLFSSGAKVTVKPLEKSDGDAAGGYPPPYVGTPMPPISLTFSSEDDTTGAFWQMSGLEAAGGGAVSNDFQLGLNMRCVADGTC